jgi:ABC-type Fe3+-hydroxamate transport system substrate-binding protein
VAWLIVTWLAALACSFFTFGASDAAATAATGVEAGVEGANAADKVEETTSLIERITNIIKNLVNKLKSFFQEVGKNKKLLSEGKNVIEDTTKTAAKDATETAGKAADASKDASKTASAAKKLLDPVKEKLNEVKENFNQNIAHPLQGLQQSATDRGTSSFGSYLGDMQGKEPSRLTGILTDTAEEQTSDAFGKAADPSNENADQKAAEDNGAGFLGMGVDGDLKG